MSDPVRRVASRWVELEVTGPDDDGLFTWTRRPGPDGPDRFGACVPDGHRAVRRAPARAGGSSGPSSGHVVLLDPDPPGDGPGLRWRAGGPLAAAGWLSHPDPAFRSTGLRCVLAGWRAVQGVLTRPASAVLDPGAGAADRMPMRPPPGDPAPLRRLDHGLSDDDPPPDVRSWRALLDSAVGRDGRAWVMDEVAVHRSRAGTPAHGGLSVGNLVPATTGRADVLLTGEEWGWAPAGHDAGWLLGELTEVRASASTRGDEELAGALSGLIEVVTGEAVAGGADPADLRRAALLRIALHAEDFARFVGFDDSGLAARAQLLAEVGRGRVDTL